MKLLAYFALAAGSVGSALDTEPGAAADQEAPNDGRGIWKGIVKVIKQYERKHPELEKLSTSSSSAGRNPLNPSMRAISRNDLSALHEYGCWCRFGEMGGRGKPVDDWDRHCKALQDGYECIQMDQDSCGVFTTDYNSSIGIGDKHEMSIERLKFECDKANGLDSCASRICLVEGAFIQNLIQMAFREGKRPDFLRYSHRSPLFDPAVSCSVTGGRHEESERACCGVFPFRFPYKSFNGERECCQGRTYDTNMLECCEDGRVRSFGGCRL